MAGLNLRLAVLSSLLILLSGCIYADTPEWGTGDGQIKVSIDDNVASINSKLGEGFDEDVPLIGCENSSLKVTGLIISSNLYSEHPLDDSINSAMGAAVIIHKMPYSQAESFEEGTAGRVSMKDWSSPTQPKEAVGSKLADNVEDWAVIGIIPASENIANGLNVLEHWHQPIQLTGYVTDASGVSSAIGENCVLEGQGHGMVVTNIKTAEGIVSIDGESDDEYSLGDTDIFGGWTFILFFLVVGVGGGVGLFIVSTMVIRQGAKATAETLLGREGFAKALQMKKDLKKSRKEGLESAADRAEKVRKQNPPPKTPKKKEEPAIAGFNLDSVLSSSDSEDSGPVQFGGGNSVVITDESKEMTQSVQTQTQSQPQNNAPMPSTNVVSTQPEPARRGHFSASAPTRSAPAVQDTPKPTTGKPVKRRAVKKRAATVQEPEPEPAPQPARQSSPSVADDDDFSDFSF